MIAERLDEHREDLERAALTRVFAIVDPTETRNSSYLDGLRSTVIAAIDYGLAGIVQDSSDPPAVPAPLLTQARLAAHSGVGLDTVMRRYCAGQALLNDFVVDQADAVDIDSAELKRLLRRSSTLLDHVLIAISEEYGREAASRLRSPEHRLADRIRSLLRGELVDVSDLSYEFDQRHLGLVAAGHDAADAIRALAASLDRRLLLVPQRDGTTWGWLGGRLPPDATEVESLASSLRLGRSVIALGEPGDGLAGWRLTHRQAAAALPIARRNESITRYRNVALLASVHQDDLLVESLRRLYLYPLKEEQGSGGALRETLRTYLAVGRNVSSTAAVLDVSRRTVTNRLRVIEERLGCPVSDATPEIEVAVNLTESI